MRGNEDWPRGGGACSSIQGSKCKVHIKTEKTSLLTQICVDNIVEDSTEVVRGTVKALKSGSQYCLVNAGINFDALLFSIVHYSNIKSTAGKMNAS